MANQTRSLDDFAPPYAPDTFEADERRQIAPFFTNLDRSVFSPLIFAPELIGALCSRTSRAAEDLRTIFLREYVQPFVSPVRNEKDTEESWAAKVGYGEDLKAFIDFLEKHPILELFANPQARSFYLKWLAQFGDDSIAQMAGSHLVYGSLSQIAIKHIEDQRIGLAPIEKSTRYVNYGSRVNNQYLYYTDPTLADLGLKDEYEAVMDGLFDTYVRLLPQLIEWLSKRYPEEKPTVVEKKAFDTLRLLLPTATLSQLALYGNGQAFEYMVSRSMRHPLGEIRWAGEQAYQQLSQATPSFLRRIKDEEKAALVAEYQIYLAEKQSRGAPFVDEFLADEDGRTVTPMTQPSVQLVEFDPDGENKVLAGLIYHAPNNHRGWGETLAAVKKMSTQDKVRILNEFFRGRTARWQKVRRAFEHATHMWEIGMNVGAWRDLHRHRMLTQQRQYFTVIHGYDVPEVLIEAGLEADFRVALDRLAELHEKIAAHDLELAQYAVALAHRVRFVQRTNLRQEFWQLELRTIPEGHPDYRHIAQAKFRKIEEIYPLIARHMLVNLGEYDFARRGQEEKIQAKLKQLSE